MLVCGEVGKRYSGGEKIQWREKEGEYVKKKDGERKKVGEGKREGVRERKRENHIINSGPTGKQS